MATEKGSGASLWAVFLAALFAGLLGGLGSLLVSELYFRPKQFQNETRVALYRETYTKRIESYQSILAMFSQVYWLERNLKAETSAKSSKEKRRLEYIEGVQRELHRPPVLATEEIFKLALAALNFYIENARDFTPEVREKWINQYYNRLVKAIREDLYQDEIRQGIANEVFPRLVEESPPK
jgi:hypothetical protein